MFRTLIYPSSGACDCVDEIPHQSSCSQFVVCWSFCCGWFWVLFVLQAEAQLCKTNTTQNQPHQNSNTQRTENKTTDVVIQQHSRKLLIMDILMSETCWAHKKWNKIASDIKLVFHSSSEHLFLPSFSFQFWPLLCGVSVCTKSLSRRYALPVLPKRSVVYYLSSHRLLSKFRNFWLCESERLCRTVFPGEKHFRRFEIQWYLG